MQVFPPADGRKLREMVTRETSEEHTVVCGLFDAL